MAKAHPVVPGTTYTLVRRTNHRLFRTRPEQLTNDIFLYALAWAVEKHGCLIHASTLMSSHHHTTLTDVRGVLPDFLRDFHRTVAKALNVTQKVAESLWTVKRSRPLILSTPEDVIDAIAYGAANPVSAGLVESPEQWPGVLLWKPCTQTVRRPAVYFDPKGKAPEELQLEICLPLCLDPQTGVQQLTQAVREKVAEAREKIKAEGRKFLGATAVMAKSIFTRPKSVDGKSERKPVVKAADSSVRKACKQALRAFQQAYAVALQAWKEGDRSVEFPYGTWWMRVHHRARVAAALA